MIEIQLESLEKQPMLHSNISRNKRENRRAILAAPIIILMLPFAVGPFWYGMGVMSPAISVMPASGLDVTNGQFLFILFWTGHFPTLDDWILFLGTLGFGYAVAYAIGFALVAAGYLETAVVIGILASVPGGLAFVGTIVGF